MSGPVAAASTLKRQLPTFRRAWIGSRDWLTGESLGELPGHVQRELDAQRRRNEILAGWIQAALVLLFAVLYALSRKTFAEDTILRPVPWALGIYASFTAWRLYLAYRNRLGPAMLTLAFYLWDAFHAASPSHRRDARWIWQTLLLVGLGAMVIAWNLLLRE